MKKLAIFTINTYRLVLSPVLPASCRFYPSCSEYALIAFNNYSFMKGLWLTLKRLSRCHPFNPGGYDPLK